MEDRPWLERGVPIPRWASEPEALARPAILLVDDDEDSRALLATLLEMAGFVPHSCGSAEAGLEALREQQFDLVLTDYMLPNRSGGWLLQQASREGLLHATPVLVVTAHPDPHEVEGFEIVSKPFDVDDLVDRVKRCLEHGGVTRRESARNGSGAARNGGRHHPDRSDPIDLILYVSTQSPQSPVAIENIRRILSRCGNPRVRLTIQDLSKNPEKGVEDSVAFTPALFRRSPGPMTFILGHITSPDLLLELLEGCEQG